jgi:RES domain-containing protein
MAEFKSYKSYWTFAYSVATRRRYVSDAEQTEFLQTVLATSKQETIPAGRIFWRSQRGNDWQLEDQGDEEGPYSVQAPLGPERMKPRANCAREGRANPKGIPCLYLATHEKTAVSEVRPWIGEYVSLAQFALKRDVRIVNCTVDNHKLMFHLSEPEPEERERIVWQDIDRAFSQPVIPDEDTAAYAPTQVLAEYFREHGLDGIAYRSSVGPGHNLAFFDIEVASMKNCALVQIDSMNLEFSPAANPYFLADSKADYEKRDPKP